MLMEEVRDISGMTYAQLNEALQLPDGQAERYARYPWQTKNRSPQAAGIQELENRVAKLLKRTPHTVVVYNLARIGAGEVSSRKYIEGRPIAGSDLRDYSADDFRLGYEGDWPTYRNLKSRPETLQLYAWQWGIMWERGLKWPSCEAIGLSAGTPVESFLPAITERAVRQRGLIAVLGETPSGRSLLSAWQQALTAGLDDVTLNIIEERVMQAAALAERYADGDDVLPRSSGPDEGELEEDGPSDPDWLSGEGKQASLPEFCRNCVVAANDAQ